MEISVKELRQKTRLLLDAVERGEEVTITYRGRPRARVVPLNDLAERPKPGGEDELFGIWADRDDLDDPSAWVRALRRSRYP